MRRGCIISTAVTALVILIGGYFGYKYIRSLVAVPDDLKPYEESAATLAMIQSHAPPPPNGSRLTQHHVDLYLEAVDSVGKGFAVLRAELDSMGLTDPDDASADNLISSPSALRPLFLYPLITRRAIVHFLNRNNLSLVEYEWIRQRVIAASGITRREVDSIHAVMIPPDSFLSGLLSGLKDGGNLAQFPNDSLGTLSGNQSRLTELGIDSTEVLLVTPHRVRILTRGFASLVGAERLMHLDMKTTNASINYHETENKE